MGDVAELKGFLTDGIPDSDTHSCPVIGCTKLLNDRGWIGDERIERSVLKSV
jgi:hypothetical protein